MKKLSIFTLVFLFIIYSNTFARVMLDKEINKTLEIPAHGQLLINNSFGDVSVSGWDKANTEVNIYIEVNAKNESKAQRYLDNIDIDFSQMGNRHSIKTDIENEIFINASYKINIDVKMPKSVALETNTHFGKTKISDINSTISVRNANGDTEIINSGQVRLANSFGNVQIQNIKGEHNEIRCNNGDIEISSIFGDNRIVCKFGKLMLKDGTGKHSIVSGNGDCFIGQIKGRLDINSQFGDATLEDIEGPVYCSDNNGNIFAKKIGQDMRVVSSFGRIEISDAAGPLNIRGQNSSIEVNNCKDKLEIKNSFGKIILNNIMGDTEINHLNGDIEAVNIGGNFTVEAQFSTIIGSDIKGSAEIINNNGKIRLKNLGGSSKIETNFSNIELNDVFPKISASAQNGDIIISKIKPGQVEFDLSTSFGDVDIRMNKKFTGKMDLYTKMGFINIENLNGLNEKLGSTSHFINGLNDKNGSITTNAVNGGISILGE